MAAEQQLPGHELKPFEEGYRTPTIEDVEAASRLHARYENPHGEPTNGSSPSGSYFPARPQIRLRSPSDGRQASSKQPAGGRLSEKFTKETTTDKSKKVSIRERVRHFTWTWFTMSMATGGMANVIYNLPFRFHGLYAIGCIFFLLNIVLFLFNVSMISIRFALHHDTFHASFTHPTESLFIPASIVSAGTILINISQYGLHETGYWLNTTVLVFFWIYCAFAIVASCGIYLILWSTQTFTISQMTPIWVFPAYPLLIVGPHASVLSASLTPQHALDIIIGGFTLQAIGFMVSLMIYSAFLYRLMTQKLPKEPIRPGMFVSVGPAAFTVSGLVGMGANLERVLPDTFMGDGKMAAFVLRVVANFVGIWLWGLALWFFIISVGAHFSTVHKGGMPFAMTWYSFVFPQTALTTATLAIGKAFGSHAIQVIGTVFAALLAGVWIFVFVANIKAVLMGHIPLPQQGEDRDEGGFEMAAETKRFEEEGRRKKEEGPAVKRLARRFTEKV